MKRTFMLLALCATVAVPAGAFAQAGPGPGQPAQMSPEQRATMEKLRADAKTSAYNALTPAHRDRVTAIVADVAAGKETGADAVKAINDLLTPDEQKAVRDASTASFQAMRTAMGVTGPPPGPPNAAAPGPNAAQPGPNAAQPAPNGPPPPRGYGPGGSRYRPSPGRYLLMVSLTRAQTRNLQPRARSTSAP
jgi:hypothetical protein